MKFCSVLGHYPKDLPGGAEYQSYLICRELAKRGHKAFYLAHRSEENLKSDDEGIHVIRSKKENNISRKIKILKQIDADFYYFRNLNDVGLATICSLILDGKIIYNISHDSQCQPVLANSDLIKKKSRIKHHLLSSRISLYRWLLKSPDILFVQTQQQQQQLLQNRSLQSSVVGNGHPVPSEYSEKTEPPVVLWLASLKEWKRPDIFIDVAESCSDLDCEFWLVGRPVENDIKRQIETRVSSLDSVRYLGGCSIEESNSYFSKASIFINTSESEGFPNTFIQSWLRETPVLSLSFDPDEILKNNNVGYLVESQKDMEGKVRQLISHPEKRKRIGREAKRYAEENHSIISVADRIESVLNHE